MIGRCGLEVRQLVGRQERRRSREGRARSRPLGAAARWPALDRQLATNTIGVVGGQDGLRPPPQPRPGNLAPNLRDCSAMER